MELIVLILLSLFLPFYLRDKYDFTRFEAIIATILVSFLVTLILNLFSLILSEVKYQNTASHRPNFHVDENKVVIYKVVEYPKLSWFDNTYTILKLCDVNDTQCYDPLGLYGE